MTRKLKYFCYISRSKVSQLYDQLTEIAVREQTVKRSKGTEIRANAEAGGILGIFKGALHTAGRKDAVVESVGSETVVQRLGKIIEHIEERENVLDLNDLCSEAKNVPLNAFCYCYSGMFSVEGVIDRGKQGSIRIRAEAFDHLGDTILISKKALLQPAQLENGFEERGPNNSRIVSDMCLLMSKMGEYTLSLACSFKYFGDMSGTWYEDLGEWVVSPHSGNYHFFHGHTRAWFESLLFITGVCNKTIMGTPLFLVHGLDPKLRI